MEPMPQTKNSGDSGSGENPENRKTESNAGEN